MLTLAKYIIIIGITMSVTGGIIYLLAKLNLQLDKLPGNIVLGGDNFTCVFALGVSLILSILLTLVFNIFLRINK